MCIFVNLENTCSKTDQPMIWNQPAEVQLEKYRKGYRIETMFPSATGNRSDLFYKCEDVVNITSTHLLEDVMLSSMVNSEVNRTNNRVEKLREKEEKETKFKELLKELVDL